MDIIRAASGIHVCCKIILNPLTKLTQKSTDPDENPPTTLVRNPNLAEEMGWRARAFVEQGLNPEKHYQGLMQVYRRATEKKEVGPS